MEKNSNLVPTPVNRGIIAENPFKELSGSALILDEKLEQEAKIDKAKLMFPDGVVKYKVLYVDPNVTQVKVGDVVSLSRSGEMRFEEFESVATDPENQIKSKRKLLTTRFNEGDVAAIWKTEIL